MGGGGRVELGWKIVFFVVGCGGCLELDASGLEGQKKDGRVERWRGDRDTILAGE